MEIKLTQDALDELQKIAEKTSNCFRIEKYETPEGDCKLTVKPEPKQDGDVNMEVGSFCFSMAKELHDSYSKMEIDFNKGAYDGGMKVKAEK